MYYYPTKIILVKNDSKDHNGICYCDDLLRELFSFKKMITQIQIYLPF